VHGISNEFLRDKPKFEPDVADELLDYLQGAEIIIHNAAFDVGFLNKELELPAPAVPHRCGQRDRHPGHGQGDVPGKRNSLDALCDRLGVDNSGRTLHGALLDAELLADVYINLTRGQDALLIDDARKDAGGGPAVVRVDLSQFACRSSRPTSRKLAAHEDVLKQLDKASGGKTVWRAQTLFLWHNLRLVLTAIQGD
jgi:DNA polymerase-3 subunit epsilon